MQVKKIGTIQEDGKSVDLFGVKAEDGRWVVSKQKDSAALSDVLTIESKPTFGQIKQAAAERFSGATYAFDRYQPSVDREAEESAKVVEEETPETSSEAETHPEAEVEEAEPEIPGTETVTDEELPETDADEELPEPAVETEKSEAEMIRDYMTEHPDAANKDVVAAFAEAGVEITSSQVSAAKRQLRDSE